MQSREIYQALAHRLDSFPQGFPSSKNGKELDLLAYLFSPEEAHLASEMSLAYEPLDDICKKVDYSQTEGRNLIKSMGNKGLISIRRGSSGIEVQLLPFVVGFYENQVFSMDETFAQLFEEYYRETFHDLLSVEPQFHRVIPIHKSFNFSIEILPEENVSELLSRKQAWAVLDCVCRKQQALLGQACDHPLKMCLAMSDTAGAFDGHSDMEALDLEGALTVLDEAARSGLVHTISNQKRDISYICNCCTCSCALLRGIAEANIANVVARSSYFALVDEERCVGCANCEVMCQFSAIAMSNFAEINQAVCVGCGVCARVCPEDAIMLSLRDSADIIEVPDSSEEWLEQRRNARGID